MIVSIQGTLIASTAVLAVIESGGLGYEVHLPVTTAEKLPPPGAQVRLHTHAVYREDAQMLYGFATVAERDFFRLLIGQVSGVGPKSALTIMSKLSLNVLDNAIRAGATGAETGDTTPTDTHQRDAVAALVALGYKPADADQAIRRAALALGAGAATDKLIKKALGSG